MDLLQELGKLTKDDTMVLAALKNIFDCYNVRLVRSLAPVRLVVTSHAGRREIGKRVRDARSSGSGIISAS
jgi:hypothetical protein